MQCIEHAQTGHVTQLTKGSTDPGFVVQVGVVVELQPLGVARKRRGALPGLAVMEDLFRQEAVRREHQATLW